METNNKKTLLIIGGSILAVIIIAAAVFLTLSLLGVKKPNNQNQNINQTQLQDSIKVLESDPIKGSDNL